MREPNLTMVKANGNHVIYNFFDEKAKLENFKLQVQHGEGGTTVEASNKRKHTDTEVAQDVVAVVEVVPTTSEGQTRAAEELAVPLPPLIEHLHHHAKQEFASCYAFEFSTSLSLQVAPHLCLPLSPLIPPCFLLLCRTLDPPIFSSFSPSVRALC
ncbi:hypothetical protein VNO78_01180 [Psophocarpus tetragonolobus]|uniref:Uncharacterized protein n=1 Tax=Psophocarpus tetragonolobus TaxID=3891 RepID=A0AAN9T1D3_PSOTE